MNGLPLQLKIKDKAGTIHKETVNPLVCECVCELFVFVLAILCISNIG